MEILLFVMADYDRDKFVFKLVTSASFSSKRRQTTGRRLIKIYQKLNLRRIREVKYYHNWFIMYDNDK